MAIPHLDVIDHDTMEYVQMERIPIGGFSWDAHFRVKILFGDKALD